MSIGRRAYDMLRGYVSTEWERIKDVERDLAERELRQPVVPTPKVSTPETMPQKPEDRRERARKLLGLSENCSFEEIRKAYVRLNKRSDPSNFPSGSQEATKATDIHRKVNWAYAVLTEDMDETERRFRTLELD